MHFLERDIIINADPGEVWDFLATPVNLNRLTPPGLHFEVLSELPEKMSNGLMILYRIKIPLFGSQRWLTEIKHINEGFSFVDEQRLGPYRFWHHLHQIEELPDGRTRMLDRVSYKLPFGPLGSLAHALLVKGMLRDIFDYRSRRLKEIFPD